MKIGIWNNYNVYGKNRIFDKDAYKIGDDLGYPMRYFKQYLEDRGHEICTIDMRPPEYFDKVIFFDYPSDSRFAPEKYSAKGIPCYLFLMEVEIVNPRGYDPGIRDKFKKVFTFDESLVVPEKMLKFNIPHTVQPYTAEFAKDYEERPGFAVMIAGDKSSGDARELYTARREVIEWFEENEPGEFDLYGTGWGQYTFKGPKPIRALNRIRFLTELLGEPRPSFRGRASSKRAILANYRFSICYENARDIPGYITEKIFDSMACGCIPVYRGSPTIADVIGKDSYIDASQFSTIEEMEAFMKRVGPHEYSRYKESILDFFNGAKAEPFRPLAFCELVEREILNDRS